jgi:hypothetical protein
VSRAAPVDVLGVLALEEGAGVREDRGYLEVLRLLMVTVERRAGFVFGFG